MNSPAKDIATILESSSSALGLVLGTDLFVFEEPSSPDEVVTIYDTGGIAPHPNYEYLSPSVQIRVRGKKFDTQGAYTICEGIRNVLHGLINQIIGGARYVQILAMGDIISLGFDENNRPVYTVNFEINRVTA
jgi:hypothetical protein